jgi:hypothetical protein
MCVPQRAAWIAQIMKLRFNLEGALGALSMPLYAKNAQKSSEMRKSLQTVESFRIIIAERNFIMDRSCHSFSVKQVLGA